MKSVSIKSQKKESAEERPGPETAKKVEERFIPLAVNV